MKIKVASIVTISFLCRLIVIRSFYIKTRYIDLLKIVTQSPTKILALILISVLFIIIETAIVIKIIDKVK